MDWIKDEYSSFVERLMRPNEQKLHSFLGLSAEAGEVLDVYKKERIYGKETTREEYIDELGDVLFYFTSICNIMDIDIEEIKRENIKKLEARYGKRTRTEDKE